MEVESQLNLDVCYDEILLTKISYCKYFKLQLIKSYTQQDSLMTSKCLFSSQAQATHCSIKKKQVNLVIDSLTESWFKI